MELNIYNTLDFNNITINVLNCLNNSLIHEISNITCEDLINSSIPNAVKEKTKLSMSRSVLFAMCFVIIVINSIVVISSGLIIRSNRKANNAFILLGNVSLADVIMGIFITIGLCVPRNYVSLLTCMLQLGAPITSTIASLYSVGLIAVDRYLYIMHGMYYQRWMNRTRVRLMISAIWILSVILGFQPILGWTGEMKEEQCWYVRLTPLSIICISAIISLFPVVTACVLYIIILIKAIRTVDKIQESIKITSGDNKTQLRIFRGRYQRNETANSDIVTNTSENSEKNMATSSTGHIVGNDKSDFHKPWYSRKQPACSKLHKTVTKDKTSNTSDLSKWKAVKVVLLTTGSMVITWVPYMVVTLMYVVCDKKTSEDFCMELEAAISGPLPTLGVFNSILNPIIYAWLHRDFKRSIKTIILKILDMRRATLSISRNTKLNSNSKTGNASQL